MSEALMSKDHGMKNFFHRDLLPLSFLLVSYAIAQAQLEPFGLPGREITALALSSKNLTPWEYYLCAGTDSSGVFRRSLSFPDCSWVNLGLDGKKVTALHVYHWGVGPAAISSILAGVRPNKSAGDSTLLYQFNQGSWVAVDSGLNAGLIDQINSIGGFFFTGHSPPEPIFTGNGGAVYRAIGFLPGVEWQSVWSMGGSGVVNTIHIHRIGVLGSYGTVWAGGETGFLAPFLAKSVDKGNTWEEFYPSLGGDNACYSIAVDPLHPDTLYAGMEGMIIKTIDGGRNWIITALRDTPYYFLGVVVDPTNSDHVIAGGSSNTNEPALYETYDGGDSWTEVGLNGLVSGISSMIADSSGGEFVVYIGTSGDGVYRYNTPLTSVGEKVVENIPKRFGLYQNHPNPFNAETMIEYSLPSAMDVRLDIYDLLGQEVCTLVNGQRHAGRNQVRWDGKNESGQKVVSGIYIYRLVAGRFAESRKLLLLR
jgi:hypothetical protein